MFERTVSLWRRVVDGRRQPRSADAGQSKEDERRVWLRHPSSAEINCQQADASNAVRVAARVRNISQGGISLSVKHRFSPGDMLTVELPGGDEHSVTTVLACVLHAAKQEDDWVLGCNFSARLGDEDLQGFGARRIRAKRSDLRTWERFACDVKATFCTLDDPPETHSQAKVLNISASGVGLLVNRAQEAGTLLTVELFGPHSVTSTIVLACVVHVNAQEDGQAVLGCTFIDELSDETMHSLL